MRFSRKAGAPSDRSPNRLLVEPAELARKLVKEMDDHVVSHGEETWARNRYTIYLCPKDFENLSPKASKLTSELASKLAKHAADEAYLIQGDLSVNLVRDDQLDLGYFGVLAEKASAVGSRARRSRRSRRPALFRSPATCRPRWDTPSRRPRWWRPRPGVWPPTVSTPLLRLPRHR